MDGGEKSNVVSLEVPRSKKEKLDIYCNAYCNGKSKKEAFIEAGYSAHSADKAAYAFHRDNLEYITAYIQEHIGSHAPTALTVILSIMNDEREKGGIRLKAAQDVLDRAGFNAKTKVELTTKEAHDMSTEELKDQIQSILSDDPALAKIFDIKRG